MTGFDIGSRRIGDGAPCLIVAEVAQAHDGSLGMAHAYIDAVSKAGADAVKFQCHLGDVNNAWRSEPQWKQDVSRKAYWERTGFLVSEWEGLADHAKESGLCFLCSPFSIAAVEVLEPLVPAWKIPSGQITNREMLDAINATRKPVILSSGMSTLAELDHAHDNLQAPRAVLQCTSAYPCRPDQVGLGLMASLFERYNCPVGLSDHSGSIYPSLAAVALGASIVEVHVCFDGAYSLDAEASITPKELRRLVNGAWWIEQAKKPVDKDVMARELEPLREVFLRKWERARG